MNARLRYLRRTMLCLAAHGVELTWSQHTSYYHIAPPLVSAPLPRQRLIPFLFPDRDLELDPDPESKPELEARRRTSNLTHTPAPTLHRSRSRLRLQPQP